MLTPLNPGIYAVTPQLIVANQSVELQVLGYNTNFEQNESTLRAFIKLDDAAFEVPTAKVLDDRNVLLQFVAPNFPDSLATKRRKMASVILHNDEDGTMSWPMGLQYNNAGRNANSPTVVLGWQPMNYEVLFPKSGMHFPFRNTLHETIRNLFYHVSLWFAMVILLMVAVYHSIQVLRTSKIDHDHWASSFTMVGILYGFLGIVTGSIWAKFTWGAFWTSDVKLNMSTVAWLLFAGYAVLRMSIDDPDRRAKVSAAFNIFAFVALIPLIFVIPRLTDSLHPGNGGNPGLGVDDLDNTMRMVFYPAIIGFLLLGGWIASLRIRYLRIQERVLLST